MPSVEYAWRLNTKLMARLNTRDKEGKVHLYESQGNVYPGGNEPLNSFGDNFRDTGGDSSNRGDHFGNSLGNAVLRGELKKYSNKRNVTNDFDRWFLHLNPNR